MQEHRRINRWQINHPAKIKLEGILPYLPCRINNLSLCGAEISLKQKLFVDKSLKLNIMLKEGYSFTAEAWIVWHKRILETNIYGIYFSEISGIDKEKIYKFVLKYFPGQLQSKSHGVREITLGGGEAMPSGEKFEDKRVFERVAARLPLSFLNLNSGKEGQGATEDFSAKGIGLVTNEELAMHTPIELWVRVPDKSEPLYTRGEVVWSRRIEPKGYRMGINLEKADLVGFSRILRAVN